MPPRIEADSGYDDDWQVDITSSAVDEDEWTSPLFHGDIERFQTGHGSPLSLSPASASAFGRLDGAETEEKPPKRRDNMTKSWTEEEEPLGSRITQIIGPESSYVDDGPGSRPRWTAQAEIEATAKTASKSKGMPANEETKLFIGTAGERSGRTALRKTVGRAVWQQTGRWPKTKLITDGIKSNLNKITKRCDCPINGR